MTPFRPWSPEDAPCHQAVPDEQHQYDNHAGLNEAGPLTYVIKADELADHGGQEDPDDTQCRGHKEAARMQPRCQPGREQSGEEAEGDDFRLALLFAHSGRTAAALRPCHIGALHSIPARNRQIRRNSRLR